VKVHPKGKTEKNLLVPDDFPRGQMPVLVAPKFRKDILLVVGSEDNRTPQWMSEKIYNALPSPALLRYPPPKSSSSGGGLTFSYR
jgi:hypothetical protein